MDGFNGKGSSSDCNAGNVQDSEAGLGTMNLFSLSPPGAGAGSLRPFTGAMPASGSGGLNLFPALGGASGSRGLNTFADAPAASGSGVFFPYGGAAGASGSAGFIPFGAAPPPPGSVAYNLYASAPPGFAGASVNPHMAAHPYYPTTASHLGLSRLTLNASSGFSGMMEYEGFLQSGDYQAGGSTSRGAPSVGMPSATEGEQAPPARRQRGRQSRGCGGCQGRAARAQQEGINIDDDEHEEFHRANWTQTDTKIFRELYCEQIEKGICKNGIMYKDGWDEVAQKFEDLTGKRHNSEQFGSRFRELKKMWNFIFKLKNEFTGLRRRADGSVIASDSWWADNVAKYKGKQDWFELKYGWPVYLPKMDRMYQKVAVTGTTAFVPGVSRQLTFSSSGGEQEGGDESGSCDIRGSPELGVSPPRRGTPASSGSKRTSAGASKCTAASGGKRTADGTRSTASTPSKRRKNAAERAVEKNMSRFNSIQENKNRMLSTLWEKKTEAAEKRETRKAAEERKKEEEKAKRAASKNLVFEAAKEMLGPDDPEDVWRGVLNIMKDDDVMDTFLRSPIGCRRVMIKQYADMVEN